MNTRINTGLVKKDDELNVITLTRSFTFKVQEDGYEELPSDTILCYVNGELRVDRSYLIKERDQE